MAELNRAVWGWRGVGRWKIRWAAHPQKAIFCGMHSFWCFLLQKGERLSTAICAILSIFCLSAASGCWRRAIRAAQQVNDDGDFHHAHQDDHPRGRMAEAHGNEADGHAQASHGLAAPRYGAVLAPLAQRWSETRMVQQPVFQAR